MKNQPGYKLPSEPDSGSEFYRICVAVPRRWEYLVAFFGTLEYLGTWLAWERDTARNGKIAAGVWRAANEITHENFEQGECTEPMTFDMRVKPGTPWVTEVSTDGGVSWHDAIIQPHWDPYQYHEPVSAERAEELAALIYRNFHEYIANKFATDLGLSVPKLTTISGLMATFAPYGAGAAFESALGEAYDTFAAAGAEAQASYTGDCAFFEDQPTLKDLIQQYADWMNRLGDWMVNSLNSTSDALIGSLNAAAGAISGSMLAQWAVNGGGGGGGADFGGDCEVEYDFEFEGAPYRLVGPITHTIGTPSGIGSDHSDLGSRWKTFERDLPEHWTVVGEWARVLHTPSDLVTSSFNPDPASSPDTERVPHGYAGGGWGGANVTFAWLNAGVGDGVWDAAGLSTPDHQVAFDQGLFGNSDTGPFTMKLGIATSVDTNDDPEHTGDWTFYVLEKYAP